MSSFLPIESYPYWVAPRRPSGDKNPGQDATEQAETEEHRGRHLNEALAHVLHVFNLHYYGEPTHKNAQPRVDVVESKAAFAVYVELPGMSRDEVHVEVNDHLFTISFSGQLKRWMREEAAGDVSVEHKDAAIREEGSNAGALVPTKALPEAEEKQGHGTELHWHITERKWGHFHRVLQLPIGFVEMRDVKASMARGLLTITVPKRDDGTMKSGKKGRKVEVIPETKGESDRGVDS